MTFEPRAIFANLAEQERIKGHHSPEGRAMRTLGRALDGWVSGNLGAVDALVLCDQAIEDWLKARLRLTPWSARSLPELLEKAIEKKWVTRLDAVCLRRLHNARMTAHDSSGAVAADEVQSWIEFSIQLVEKQWK